MNYITDYQLDIDRGFQCKVNGKLFEMRFNESCDEKHWFINDSFRKLLIELKLHPDVAVKPYGKFKDTHLFYCDSKQQCYDLCQSIVSTYFKPINITNKETKELCERSRRYLTKYYADDESYVILNNVKWLLLRNQQSNIWYFYNAKYEFHTYFRQFGINNAKEVIDICSKLGLSAKFTKKLEFDSRQDAIKFTDYLIETYIIKKEQTYDTNQLRKERAVISRGAKPAGSIIHGRRSKASIRCGCIEHKACLGN